MESVEIQLDEYEGFPRQLTDLNTDNILEYFPNPSLIHLKGSKSEPLFVSVLLHGNELTSLAVLKKIEEHFREQALPRDLKIFVGNVTACQRQQRFFGQQKDYNRIWSSGGDSDEEVLAQRVIEKVKSSGPIFASIDIHNNTGANPLYGCISKFEPADLYLGSLFGKTLVYFLNPSTTQSVTFSKWCPAITLECGKSLEPSGVEKSFQLVVDVLHLESLEHDISKLDIHIFETVARMYLDPEVTFSFDPLDESSLKFPADHDVKNFRPLQEGHVFAMAMDNSQPIKVHSNGQTGLEKDYFVNEGGMIKTTQEFYPSMLTLDKEVIRQDCLGYIMKLVDPSRYKKDHS
jgi:succinylglutamate desuccinylase